MLLCVRSLTIEANRHHNLPSFTPSLSELVSRFPDIKTLCIEWSYDWSMTEYYLPPGEPIVELAHLEELRIDIRRSKVPGDASVVIPVLLAHLGLKDVRKLVVQFRHDGGELDVSARDILKGNQILCTSLELLQPVEFDFVWEMEATEDALHRILVSISD